WVAKEINNLLHLGLGFFDPSDIAKADHGASPDFVSAPAFAQIQLIREEAEHNRKNEECGCDVQKFGACTDFRQFNLGGAAAQKVIELRLAQVGRDREFLGRRVRSDAV